MAFHVKQTAQADRDLDAILDWLFDQQAGETGVRWFYKLREALDSLSDLPHRCPLAPENPDFPFEVRQLIYGAKPHLYRVLFTIEADSVIILHIRHGRRLPLTGGEAQR
ncbi:MAG TPA: type II toxin-antitoxin system RelE/ParE family toxin [Acidobacteriaceae bacterium]|jgi:plasmid stabilization system protein ParE|nr:type II toxin-antitoxin system RelE/ParE family toxin [Acidobacteriaceae bacterium]